MNYKKILFYYLNHVGYMEGTTFINSIDYVDELSEDEKNELRRLGGLDEKEFEKEFSDEL